MESGQDLLRFGPFRVDAFQRLWRGDQIVDLAARPLAVLRYLAERPGQVITKQELLRELWAGTYVTRAVLKVAVRTLREALGEDARAPLYIETVGWEGYRFIASLREEARGLGLETSPLSPQVTSLQPLASNFVGRESELMQLDSWFDKARQGQRQLVFVTGEPGIGKTTLIDAFVFRVQNPQSHEESQKSKVKTQKAKVRIPSPAPSPQPLTPGMWVGRGQCVEQYGQGEAYLPILEALSRLAHEPGGRRIVEVLRRYAPTWLAQLPALLEAKERRELQATVQGATQQRMLRELTEALEALTVERPLVLILEDLHWSDVSTLEVLAYVGQRRGRARLLIIGTYRPIEVIMQGHRLKGVKQELETHGQCAELRLELLTVDDVNAYLTARLANGSLLPTLAAEVHRRTEGNALFMVNLVEAWVRQGVIARNDGHWLVREPFAANPTPETVRQMIEKQLERLGKQEQRLLETASVAGTEFTVAAIAAGLKGDLDKIEDRCEALALQGHFLEEHGIAEWPDGTVSGRYGFRHALYQNVLYERIAEMRRMRLHRLIGERLETGYGERTTEVAAELAVHFEQGRDYRRAVQYLRQAGERAVQRSANVEAISHLTKGLELLKTLPDTSERDQQELTLQIALNDALVAVKGFTAPDVEKAVTRARELCQQIEETPQLFPMLFRLLLFYYMRGELQTAREMTGQLIRLAQSVQDQYLLSVALMTRGCTLFLLGESTSAWPLLEQAIALYDPQKHPRPTINTADPRLDCLSYGSWTLWSLGYPAQALKKSHEAVAIAAGLSHPFSLAYALGDAALLHLLCREREAARERAQAAMILAIEQGFPYWMAFGTVVRGWALAEQGQVEEGIAQMQQSLAALQAMGTEVQRPHFLALLAEAHTKKGQIEEGRAALAEALALVDKTGERYYEAELYRLRGELTLQGANQKLKGKSQKSKVETNPQSLTSNPQGEVEQEAEEYFQKAIDISRQQQAKSLELRAVMSLVRLRQQGTDSASRNTHHVSRARLDEARSMLSEIYGWFTEGFDTKDLQEAKALLESLSS